MIHAASTSVDNWHPVLAVNNPRINFSDKRQRSFTNYLAKSVPVSSVQQVIVLSVNKPEGCMAVAVWSHPFGAYCPAVAQQAGVRVLI